LLLLFIYCASAQNPAPPQVIKGRVIDAQTRKPIGGATVYLNGTYIGTSTDTLGNFSFSATLTGIPLEVSCVGYETQTINSYGDKDLVVALKYKVIRLSEITIKVDEMSREKKMKIFLREFIGLDVEDYFIDNPDDIWLHYNKKTSELTAGSDKPLLIYNKTLGYKITYFLDTFRYAENSARGSETNYRGNYFFAEDTAGLKPRAIKKILQARDDAYYGSRMHFIRALWANQLSQNDYKIIELTFNSPRLNVYDEKKSKKLFYEDIVGIKDDRTIHNQKYMVFKKEVAVLYQQRKRKAGDSYIKQKDDYLGILIDSNGYFGEGIDWNGDMGHDRVGKLLPFEFQPVGK